MKRLALVLILAAGLAVVAHAQNYRFAIPEAEVTVTIQPDGAALIQYRLTFTCRSGAHPIERRRYRHAQPVKTLARRRHDRR